MDRPAPSFKPWISLSVELVICLLQIGLPMVTQVSFWLALAVWALFFIVGVHLIWNVIPHRLWWLRLSAPTVFCLATWRIISPGLGRLNDKDKALDAVQKWFQNLSLPVVWFSRGGLCVLVVVTLALLIRRLLRRHSTLVVTPDGQGVVSFLVQNRGSRPAVVQGIIFVDTGIANWPEVRVYAIWKPAIEPSSEETTTESANQEVPPYEDKVKIRAGDTRRLIMAAPEEKQGRDFYEFIRRWIVPYSYNGLASRACSQWFSSREGMTERVEIRVTIIATPPLNLKTGMMIRSVIIRREGIFFL